MAKVSLNDLRMRASTVDRAQLDATTDAQIEAYKAEDGYADLPVPDAARVVESPQALRVRLGMTQREMAAALCIPLGTWRNWEQGRVLLEPAAAALLVIVSRMPEAAMDALGGVMSKPVGPGSRRTGPRDTGRAAERSASLGSLLGLGKARSP